MSRPFVVGEKVVLVDTKKRRYLITLKPGAEFHSHAGFFRHEDLIGIEEGITVRSSGGARYTAIRPTLSEYVLKMPRGAQVIYPKDLGAILMVADVFPGARVFESGVGSGALSMTLLRAGAHVTGYEIRDDFAAKAMENVGGFLGADAVGRYDVHVRSSYDAIEHEGFDRVVLDLPEPWQVVPHLPGRLRTGGILLAYLPTINQTSHLRACLAASGFAMAETIEVLHRGWHIEGASVRPDHRMVAHTGFLTHARYLATDDTSEPASVAVWGRGRAERGEPADADLNDDGLNDDGDQPTG